MLDWGVSILACTGGQIGDRSIQPESWRSFLCRVARDGDRLQRCRNIYGGQFDRLEPNRAALAGDVDRWSGVGDFDEFASSEIVYEVTY